MVFSDSVFWLFLLAVIVPYAILPLRGQNVLLLAASLIFYGWWDARFLSLLLVSTVIDYACALGMVGASPRRRRNLLLASMVSNLGLLGFFKYYGFFASSLAAAGARAGIDLHLPVLEIVLPVGISFYTFQTMSYTIDVYRGNLAPTRDLLDFALFVSYFPQLVAGPIERATHLLPALQAPRRVDYGMIRGGLTLILLGMVKKVAIADEAAPAVEAAFSEPGEGTALAHWVGAGLFAIQIYGDFSGYTDIARGVSLLLGIPLMRNFARPYFATSITESWRGWHISLSTWLRDYLYIPLGGNGGGRGRTYFNLMATMVLGGLWHGAAWTFVAWGEGGAGGGRRIRAVAGWAVTMVGVLLAWVLFRAPDFPSALAYLGGMFAGGPGLGGSGIKLLAFSVACMVVVDLLSAAAEGDEGLPRSIPVPVRSLAYAGLLLLLLSSGGTSDVPFIYFQF
ncbi:MAG: MBOAT family protein [Planctomycetaceae bacterium]|nr:MBOAT family protein [Planctomycetaceae bacterium]